MNRSPLFEGVVWRKSSYSQGLGQDCVELARLGGVIGIRDSKDPNGPCLIFTPAVLRAFTAQVRAEYRDLR
ncbi:DUF397 domain-containing protein [Actinomadura craniellae]|uniref:DUF397 domain-containing protein n=1 Tax=Actinomadura craniellae TaxID=2231787 RepID=A0A365GVS2_9ACTN|nr:DUF397 domain-containing protein [Actinomadura craniellae]RAY10874.1 DUF397 domain-containing protein [Actinomadura craniellae]